MKRYRKKAPIVEAYKATHSHTIEIDDSCALFVKAGEYIVHTASGVHVIPAAIFEALYEEVKPPSAADSTGQPKE